MTRAIIAEVDKKLDDEISFRLKSEDDMRQWFDQKFEILKETRNMDESRAVEREKRLMHQLSQGL